MQKKKYDTGVVMVYLLGKEQLLPKTFRKTIPYSTVSTWRKTDYASYEGHQFRFLFDQDWDRVHEKIMRKSLEAQLRRLVKVWLLFQDAWLGVIKEAHTNRQLQKKILQSVRYLRDDFGLPRTLKILRLSSHPYQQWSHRKQYSCSASIHSLCLKRQPGQLRMEEIQKMKILLTASKYQRWPISSIAAHGLRKNKVAVSLYSWYKYARLMNIVHPLVKGDKKRIGVTAN